MIQCWKKKGAYLCLYLGWDCWSSSLSLCSWPWFSLSWIVLTMLAWTLHFPSPPGLPCLFHDMPAHCGFVVLTFSFQHADFPLNWAFLLSVSPAKENTTHKISRLWSVTGLQWVKLADCQVHADYGDYSELTHNAKKKKKSSNNEFCKSSHK